MRRTRFGTLLLATGWACFPLALVFHTLAPALLGVALVALVLGARQPALDLHVVRDAPERVVAGEPFTLTTRATDASGAPLWVDEETPAGVRILSRRQDVRRGEGALVLEAVAENSGVVLWGHVHVRYQDAWGVLEDTLRLNVVDTTEVRPGNDLLLAGRRAGKRSELGKRVRSPLGIEIEPEIERLRDYQPGDRLRDVDWAQVSKLGRLVTRELRHETILPVVVLLQASRSMRWQRRESKFATCARAALATAAAVNMQGLGTGLVAWSERGLEAQARVTTGRRAISEGMLRLGRLPPPILADHTAAPVVGASDPRTVTPKEREFLAAVDTFAPTGSHGTTPVEAALAGLARVATQPCLVVALIDAEETPDLVPILLSRIKQHGHRAIILAPASGVHHYGRDEVDDAVIEKLLVWRRNRDIAALTARRRGVPFLVLGPDVNEHTIREVITSASR